MANVHCFGVGLVGSYVAVKLAQSGHSIHAYDPQPFRVVGLPGVEVHHLEPDDEPIDLMLDMIAQQKSFEFDPLNDIVVNMLPGDIGHSTTTALAELPWKTVDLSFSQFTPDRDNHKAKENGARILWDTGIAPCLSNMFLSRAYDELGPLMKGEVRVGGNPTGPTGNWNYMAPFSPIDVIAEYTRPARVIRDSKLVTLPALSERHEIEVLDKGTMEAFLTDGLRSVLNTIPAEELSEYTVRWPGHIQKFIDETENGQIDLQRITSEWQYDEKTPEFTWMEVFAQGRDGTGMRWIVQDHGGDDGHSMARSTGLVTVCCVEEWLNNHEMLPPGVHPPESMSPESVDRIVSRLIEEGVEIHGPIVTPPER